MKLIIFLSLLPGGVKLCYLKLSLNELAEFKVKNIKGLQY